MTVTSLLRFLWLVWLWMIPLVIPPDAFAYDGSNQATLAYDNAASERGLGYDSSHVFATGENEYAIIGDGVLFARCAGFLAAGEGTTTLYRTVSEPEVTSINASQQYAAYNTEGKYFYPTAEQAQAQAVENYAARQGSQTLTSVTVPNSVLKGGQSINPLGEGPAFFFPTEQLPQLGKPTVWNFWPLH